MTILEQLRENKKEIITGINGYSVNEVWNLLNQYDLALENALLKLKNRAVEIKDLKYRIKEIEKILNESLTVSCQNDCNICFAKKVCKDAFCEKLV